MNNTFHANSDDEVIIDDYETDNDIDSDLDSDEFDFEDFNIEDAKITMVDENTGEEFEFIIADDFDFEGDVYCVLITTDEEPEAVFVKITEMPDGTEGFMSLDEEEFDKVSAEYDRLCAEEAELDWEEEDEDEE